ncbi:MAG: DNA polymerase I [Ruminococcaceae bacterium]|nr:DNA polymerase I [Oscillospiraceae bacterium]
MKFMIIDGNSLINRAFYGVRPLSTKEGIHTNAIFGFLNTYFKLLEEEKPQNACVCFDLKAPTFRHLQYEGYKATRKGMPEELAMQMPYIKEILDALGVPRMEKEGFEADDLLGTISKKCEDKGIDCTVVTGDKDSLQLIGEKTRVAIVSTRMGQTTTKKFDAEAFREEYNGLEPQKIIDLKAIMGDKSDNIPGVAGIGEKGAMDLLTKYGSLSGVYENLSEANMTKSVFKKLTEGRESAFMSYELATIIRDVDLGVDDDYFKIHSINEGKLYDLLAKLELFSIIKRMGLSPDEKKTEEIKQEFNMPEYKIGAPEKIGGTVGLALENEKIALFDGKNIYITDEKIINQLNNAELICIHDSKELYKRAKLTGMEITVKVCDTAVGEYLLSPTDNSYPIEKSIMRRFGVEIGAKSEENTQLDMFSMASEDHTALAQKAFYTYYMAEKIREELENESLIDLFENIEMPLVPVLAEMEVNGIRCDIEALKNYADELAVKMDELTEKIYDIAGEKFNIGSPKQLGDILFNKMGLKGGKKTKTGYSTDADTLEKLRKDAPIVEHILEYRKYAKLKSTYCDGLIKVVNADGRVRTSFNQLVTATGRLSSTDPNLQNIPVRTEEGEKIRRAFIADEGKILIDADYSQIELRILAHIANDENMLNAFNSGVDIHTSTASQVFNTPLDEVTPNQRRSAKAVNFGIVYGISAFALSEDLGVFVNEAQSYMNGYFAVYSGVKKYMDEIKIKAKEDGFVKTIFGRKRALPELKSSNRNIRSFGERVALNMPIQGAAADIMKIAMVNVYNRLKKENMKTRMLIQVHDELLLEAPLEEKEKAKILLREEMERAASLSVKLLVDVHEGANWVEAK